MSELESRPKQSGSLSEPTYIEFILVGVLAVLSVTAIVVFLDKTANESSIAKAGNVKIEESTPEPNIVTANQAVKTVDTPPIKEPSKTTIEESTPKPPIVTANQAVKTVDTPPIKEPSKTTIEESTPKPPIVTANQAVKTVDTPPIKEPSKTTIEESTPKPPIVTANQAVKTVDTPPIKEPSKTTIEESTPKPNIVTANKADQTVTTSSALHKAGDAAANSVGMKLVYVPAGSFMMGSSSLAAQLAEEYSKAERRFKGENPQHQISISKGFWMGQTEVTQGQYKSVMNAQPWSGKAYVREDANNPAVYVSWDEAREFCRKLSQREGRTYRLPTEAEWEYACRAGAKTRFSFGDDASSLGDYAWFEGNADQIGQDYAHLVGQKKPNPWGIYDMHGNVFEWCSDYYDQGYYSNSPSVDPNGPLSGTSRSLRGGSWDDGAGYLRCSYRSGYRVSRGLLVGFRVVAEGEAISDVAGMSIAVESAIDWLKSSDDKAKAQKDSPITLKVPDDAKPMVIDATQVAKASKPDDGKPVVVDATKVAKVPEPDDGKPVVVDATKVAKVPEPDDGKPVVVDATKVAKVPEPDDDKPIVVDTTKEPDSSVIVGTDRTLVYASGNVRDILDAAAVDARSGNVQQAQAALTSLLKDKEAAVLAGYELGLIHYENGDAGKAMPFFKDALAAAFPGPASGKDEQALTALFSQEADAARIRYELGLACQSQGKQDQAAKLFRDSLSIISAKDATYIGVKKCKSCHFKQWNSWRKTKMAKAFESLKPGVKSEEKTKLKFDPNKDYTKDATCLSCHTSGFGIPGGYNVPSEGDAEAREQAADNAGVTCEGCHGPGSKSVEIQEDIKENKRTYKFEELRAVGFHRAGVRSCRSCHNASDPGKEPGYHFPYEEKRKEGQHESIELKYRQD